MALPVPTSMSAPQGVGALFAPKITPDAIRRKKYADSMARIAAQNASNAKSLMPKPVAGTAQPNPPAPMDDSFTGPQQPNTTPGLLPAPQLGNNAPDAAGDPNAAMNQYAQDQLGGTEFRINRRHPAREQRAVTGPYAGQRASQAVQHVNNSFGTLPDADKQALADKNKSLLFTPKTPAPPAATTPAAVTPNPAKPAAAPLGNPQFKNLRNPIAATGQPLGNPDFSNLQKPRIPGSSVTDPQSPLRRAVGPRKAAYA